MADNQRAVEHVLVTGATGGIGKAIAMELVKKGKNVYVTGRCQKKLDPLLDELRGLKLQDQNQTIRSFCFDLGRLTDVQREMPEICKLPLDTVIFNAGILGPKVKRVAHLDDFPELEETIKVNVLGHFLMARHLLDNRAENSRREGEENHRALPPLRFVTLSSVMAKGASIWPFSSWPSDSHRFDDFFGKGQTNSDGWLSYFDSKLAAIVMAQWLNLQQSTSAVAIHPGVARTEIFAAIPTYQQFLLRPLALIQNIEETSVCAKRIYKEAVLSNGNFAGKWICNGVTDIPTNAKHVQRDSFMDFILRLTDNFM